MKEFFKLETSLKKLKSNFVIPKTYKIEIFYGVSNENNCSDYVVFHRLLAFNEKRDFCIVFIKRFH